MAVRQCYGKKRRVLLGIRRMDRVLNAWKRELCGVRKGLDERIDEGLLWWFSHMERDRIAKRVYVGECVGIRSVGRPWCNGIGLLMLALGPRIP